VNVVRVAAIGVLLVATAAASAQPLPRAEDKAEADRLFEEGRALLTEGKRAEACAKFDLSIRKDPRAVGTMLNLGLCREEVGQIATAVRFYAEARDRAGDQKLNEHKAAAERKLALLAPRVPHLAITLPAPLPARTRVLVDDLVVAVDDAGDVTLDPGAHTIVVTAPGKLPYETKVDIAESEHKTIPVPPLEGAKTIVVREPTNRRALVGKLLVAGGAVMIGAGIGVGLLARSQYWDQFPAGAQDGVAVMDATHDCWTAIDEGSVVRECNSRGQDATEKAHLLSQIGIGTAIAGGAIAVAGTLLWVTAPRNEPAPAVTFSVGADHATFAWTRSF
jgi:hypothetical protein